jgi:hypothetical protein
VSDVDEFVAYQGLAWFAIVALIVLVLSVLLFAFLDSSAKYLLELAVYSSDGAGRVDRTAGYLQAAWNLWPLWGIGLPMVLFMYRRAGTESSPR